MGHTRCFFAAPTQPVKDGSPHISAQQGISSHAAACAFCHGNTSDSKHIHLDVCHKTALISHTCKCDELFLQLRCSPTCQITTWGPISQTLLVLARSYPTLHR